MSAWFDSAAKRAARGAAATPSTSGISRRKVVAGGAAVAGLAWTAPILAAAPAHAYGVSHCATANICPPNQPSILQICCDGPIGTGTSDYTCTDDNGTWTCHAPGTLGGNCTNSGSGVAGCIAVSQHCNNDKQNNICGGKGAKCDTNADCVSNVCTNAVCS